MANEMERIRELLTYSLGDEKHETSTHSTLDVLWVLYDRVLRYDPQRPRWEGRDRFVLSKGHGCRAYYTILADKGFFPVSELRTFLRYDSMLGSHPDRNQVPGVETSTGSLGHGLPMAVGIAMALRLKGSDRRVFCLIGDGESNEGSIWEAILLAGNRQLNNLTCIAINNHSSTLDLGDFAAKFAAFGWSATTIDGRDHEQIYRALTWTDDTRPTAIVAEIAQ
jgi:transketolase